jgi:UDP-N-acetylmuramate dehydrogenase
VNDPLRESGHGAAAQRERIAAALRERITGDVTENASLAPFTTFRVGGPADVLVEAASEDDLRAVADLRDGLPVAIVGRGSNLLVSDDGFRGIAVRLGRAFKDHASDGRTLRLGGAVHLPAAARLCARLGLAGFEFAAEIPATFGGAVRMNAGAHGRCVADVLSSAVAIDLSSGDRRELDAAELEYGYRHSSLRPADVVTSGTLLLEPGEPSVIGSTIASYLKWRRENQPPGRSAGSVFKNPPDDSAGRLIDAVGAKGMRVGGAEVSPVHANFIVADPGAAAADVWVLIARISALVLERTGVRLEPEVRFLGAFPDPSEPDVEG